MGDLSENFSRREFECSCGCGMDTVDAQLLHAMQALRDHYGRRVEITSACRCSMKNRVVGGARNSQHIHGRACDFKVAGVEPREVQQYLEMKYPDRFGVGCYETWTHFDTRTGPPARWEG